MYALRILGCVAIMLAVTPLSALQFTTASTQITGMGGGGAYMKSELDQAVVTIRHVPCVESEDGLVNDCAEDEIENYSDDHESWHTFDDGCQAGDQWVKGTAWAYPDQGPTIMAESTDQCPAT